MSLRWYVQSDLINFGFEKRGKLIAPALGDELRSRLMVGVVVSCLALHVSVLSF